MRAISWVGIVGAGLSLLESLFYIPKLKKTYASLIHLGVLRSSGGVIFDVGANRGQSIDFFIKVLRPSSIFAFEPSPSAFLELSKRNFPLEVRTLNLAISNTPGTTPFYESKFNETSSLDLPDLSSKYHLTKSWILASNPKKLFSTVQVETSTIDDIFQSYDVEDVEILKIDVEGHEYQALQGAHNTLIQGKVRVVQFEFHDDDMRESQERQISKFLKEAGFSEFVRLRHSFGNFFDAIYVRNTFLK
jgi:FkbM family methyltransferase